MHLILEPCEAQGWGCEKEEVIHEKSVIKNDTQKATESPKIISQILLIPNIVLK